MPHYQYTARNTAGELITGRIRVASLSALYEELHRLGLFPINIESLDLQMAAPVFTRGASHRDILEFTRQLARLLEAGVPLSRALDLLSRHSPSRVVQQAVSKVQEDVRGGDSLHEALSRHPALFDELYCGMVHSGEVMGQLVPVLRRLAEHHERRYQLSSSVWNTLTYPLFVMAMGLITVVFLLAVVIPRFETVFSDMGQLLPLPTRMLVSAGGFFATSWWLVAAVIVFVALGAKSITMGKEGRVLLHRFYLRLPIIGSIVRRSALARFTRVCGDLLKSGMPILDAIHMASDNTGNAEVDRRLVPLYESTREGKSLAGAFQRTGLFDPYTVDIATVSEETGALPAALLEIADNYDQEVLTAVRRLTALLEPALIIALGAMVAFIVAAMLLPILQMNLSGI